MDTPISKSQKRALTLVGLAPAATYDAAATALDAANFRRDGIPTGHTWRSAAKLSDAELLAGITLDPRRFDDMTGDNIPHVRQ
jgi:hypothetical protein